MTKNELKRYHSAADTGSPDPDGPFPPDMIESEDGGWVRWEDYERLRDILKRAAIEVHQQQIAVDGNDQGFYASVWEEVLKFRTAVEPKSPQRTKD